MTWLQVSKTRIKVWHVQLAFGGEELVTSAWDWTRAEAWATSSPIHRVRHALHHLSCGLAELYSPYLRP